jgi:transposase
VKLADEQWEAVRRFIPEPPRRADGRGRPWRETRAVLEGILWILRTDAPWHALPEGYPSYQTCHRRFQQWVRAGVLRPVLEALAQDLYERGGIDLRECFIDGSFARARKVAWESERPGRARGPSSWGWRTATVFRSPRTWQVLRPTG